MLNIVLFKKKIYDALPPESHQNFDPVVAGSHSKIMCPWNLIT
jgi:hypothetical protein